MQNEKSIEVLDIRVIKINNSDKEPESQNHFEEDDEQFLIILRDISV